MATRSDARKNRVRLLDAATELILEVGGEPARDAIARRAGVGIGTLYRHFPDQQELLTAVALQAIDRSIAAGEAALDQAEQAGDGGAALRAYLHAAIDVGLGVVNIVHPFLDVFDFPERRNAAQSVLDRIVAAAQRHGAAGADVTATDIVFASIRFCRPLALGLDLVDERAIAHRQLDIYVDGLAQGDIDG